MLGGKIESNMEGKQIGKNTFVLKRISVEPNSHSVEVDFSPSPHTSSSQLSKPIPSFNADSYFFTPGFILKSSQSQSPSVLKSYMELHESKVIQLTEEKEELLVPRPSRVNSYCLACRVYFEDYLTHLNLPAHQLAIKSSSFAVDIAKLCSIFTNENEDVEIVKVKGKAKRIAKTTRRSCRENKKFKMTLMSTSTNIGDFSEEARKQVSI